MPPSGVRSRKLAIGDASPSGAISSILVFGSEFTPLGKRKRDRYDSDEAKPAPVGDGARFGLDQQRAVLVEPSGRYLVDDTGRAGRQPHQIAVPARHHLADPGVAREFAV